MLLSLILGSSPHLPVSVCGTGTSIQYLQAFLASVLLGNSLLLFHYIFRYESFLFLAFLPLLCPLHLLSISVVQEFLPAVHRIRIFSLSLGPDLPWADEPSPGNLRLSMAWILTMLSLLTCFRYLFRHSLFCFVHMSFRSYFFLLQNAPLPLTYFYVNPQLRCIV